MQDVKECDVMVVDGNMVATYSSKNVSSAGNIFVRNAATKGRVMKALMEHQFTQNSFESPEQNDETKNAIAALSQIRVLNFLLK